jgi:Rieske Fe-S protein
MGMENRRSLLRWAIHGMGALFAAILGAPAVAYLIDARHRAAKVSGFRTVSGLRYGDLVPGIPKQGVIRNVREDAWTLHPNDVIGRVWVMKKSDGKLQVWTTVCPHLGCSINLNTDPHTGFTCPCHGAEFKPDGARVERNQYTNAAPRDMDTLEWQRDPNNPDLVQVKYQNFYQGRHSKDVKA